MRGLAFVLSLPLALGSCGQPAAPPEISDVWTRDTVGGTVNAAVFMTIRSQADDRVVGATSPIAEKVDLMTMATSASGTTEMRYVAAIDVPAGRPIFLEPSGLHVWLAGLKQPLKNGESFPLTLRFEHAGERRVTVPIIGPAAPPPMAGMKM